MIFKKFLQPKWKNDDPQVRLKALESLSGDLDKNRTILHELAFNDASDKVRKQALEVLNDFSIWWQASKKEKSDWVKRTAEDQMRKGLLGEADFDVDDKLKSEFIEQCNKSVLLEELAMKDKSDETRLKLLLKLKKNNLYTNTLQDSASSEWLKTEIVKAVEELSLLERWLKKADESIKPLLNDKVQGIKDALEKPEKLKKDVSLMLAKLNALKDKVDIEDIEQRQAQLQLEWQTLKDSFELLAEQEAKEFSAKYDKISQSVENITAPLKARWEQQKAERIDAEEKAKNKADIATRLAQIEAALTKAIGEHVDLDKETFAGPLKDIQQKMQQMNLAAADKNGFVRQIEQFYSKIEQIPLISECMAEATRLVSYLSNLAVPSNTEELKEVHQHYIDWKKQWRDNEQKVGLAFPQTITKAHKELSKKWESAVTPILAEQEKLFGQTRKALSDLRYLVSSGKYRRAFGLFKKVGFMLEQLTESQQKRVARDFDTIKTKVEDLADWQDYIATPRKQQLLEDIQELAEKPMEDPQEQAQKVKFIRQMWNSLGHSSDDKEAEVNEQFNSACEKAFETCRQFYAEKETTRATNLAAKEAVCEKLQQAQTLLQAEEVQYKEIESTLSRIRKEWKATGEVDREKVAEINKRYFDLLDPLQKALKDHHDNNATLKEKLVKTAEDLLESADVFDAASQLKDLQQKWRGIGFAGAKSDNKIWRKFREVNDKVFAKRDEVKSERMEQNQQRIDELSEQLEQIEQEILNTEQLSVLNKRLSELNSLSIELKGEPKSVQSKLGSASDKLESLINTRKKELALAADREKYVTLFAQFEQVSKHAELDPEIESDNSWNSVLSGLRETADSNLRYDLTIQLEIVHGVESPVRDTDRRMELQMSLLSDKLNAGEVAGHKELLKAWLSVGRLNVEQENELFERVKALYL